MFSSWQEKEVDQVWLEGSPGHDGDGLIQLDNLTRAGSSVDQVWLEGSPGHDGDGLIQLDNLTWVGSSVCSVSALYAPSFVEIFPSLADSRTASCQ